MNEQKGLSWVDWTAMAFFGLGIFGVMGSAEKAEKAHQFIDWPSCSAAVGAFILGAALLLWSNRR
ncbi:MAG TPA: hypothetical protein VGN42_18445 [Pirellulales bacterium]|jgi:hypothetical protein|nr:hypothetical protein [Pirellulales bacterium]